MEFAAPVLATLANALTVGRELTDLYQSLVNARTEIAERIVYIQSHWRRTKAQLEIIERTWSGLSEDHQAGQIQVLGILIGKLEAAKDRLRRLLKKPNASKQPGDDDRPAVKRWKYIFLKPHLDDTIKSLDKWQRMYDPSYYLIVRIASPLIDAELKREDHGQSLESATVRKTTARIRGAVKGTSSDSVHISLPSDGLDGAQVSRIPCSPARYVQRAERSGKFLVDSVPCPPGSYVGEMDKDLRTLATKLHCADPATFGVLKCRGVVKVKTRNGARLASFDIVFETPSPEQPRVLRSCLTSRAPHTLTERLELARQLARSVNYVHTLEFVHKNIRPENFIGFGQAQLGSFYLIGFENVRNAEGMTYYRGDVDWHKNLYHHPERQGLQPEERYCMQHDIYSLGVCLLEVGLWDSFVLYGEDGKVKAPNTALFRLSIEELRRKKPSAIKNLLVDLARRELAPLVGEIYRNVVVNCLTCLDEDNVDFGDKSEFEDADDVKVGVRFIEKILLELNSITV